MAPRTLFIQWPMRLALLGLLCIARGAQAANYEPDETVPRAPAAARPESRKPVKAPSPAPTPPVTDFAIGPAGSAGGASDRREPRGSTAATLPGAGSAGIADKPRTGGSKPGAAEPTTLRLTGPAVVILQGSAADLDKVRDDERFKDFRSGFDASTSRFLEGMKAHPQVRVMRSSADEIRFADPKLPAVQRYSVDNGHGYVFYQPGAPVRVLGNVRSGDGLLCEAARTFRWKPAPANCDVAP